MNIYLKKLSIEDGIRELEYLRIIKSNENGFCNPAEPEDLVDEKTFEAWLNQKVLESEGKNLKDQSVPQTIYWVMLEDKIIGIGKIRHHLNERFLRFGGHIALGILEGYRTKGIGTKALNLILMEAKKMGLEEVLLSNYENNFASRRIVEKCGGVLETIIEGRCKYWINIKNKNN